MGRKKVEEHTPKFTVKREGCHFRLVALREFLCHGKHIKRGEQGGLIDNELNLSQDGSCWITKDACVYGNARIEGDALITGRAIVCADAIVRGESIISDDCQVCVKSIVEGDSVVAGSVELVGVKLYGAMIKFCPKNGKLHINKYNQPNDLIIGIKTVAYDGNEYCRIVGK